MAIKLDEDNKVVVYENEPDEPRSLFPNLQEGGGVLGVLLNGISIVNENGIAIIPLASAQDFGVIKTAGNFGTDVNQNGLLYIVAAPDQFIKQASDGYRPIVPTKQHIAAFYGMAAAAGDTTQAASDNAVGTYTDEAKVAIQRMLGIYEEPFRLIKEFTITEATGTIDITTDLNGDPFSLKEFLVIFENMVSDRTAENGSISVNSGSVVSGDAVPYITIRSLYSTQATNVVTHGVSHCNRFFAENTIYSSIGSPQNVNRSRNAAGVIECGLISEICIGSSNDYTFSSGSIKVYGR